MDVNLGRGKSQECSEWQDCPLDEARVGRIAITEEEGMTIDMIVFSSWIGSQNVQSYCPRTLEDGTLKHVPSRCQRTDGSLSSAHGTI